MSTTNLWLIVTLGFCGLGLWATTEEPVVSTTFQELRTEWPYETEACVRGAFEILNGRYDSARIITDDIECSKTIVASESGAL